MLSKPANALGQKVLTIVLAVAPVPFKALGHVLHFGRPGSGPLVNVVAANFQLAFAIGNFLVSGLSRRFLVRRPFLLSLYFPSFGLRSLGVLFSSFAINPS